MHNPDNKRFNKHDALQGKYKLLLDYVKQLQGVEEYEYPFSDIYKPTEVLALLGE